MALANSIVADQGMPKYKDAAVVLPCYGRKHRTSIASYETKACVGEVRHGPARSPYGRHLRAREAGQWQPNHHWRKVCQPKQWPGWSKCTRGGAGVPVLPSHVLSWCIPLEHLSTSVWMAQECRPSHDAYRDTALSKKIVLMTLACETNKCCQNFNCMPVAGRFPAKIQHHSGLRYSQGY